MKVKTDIIIHISAMPTGSVVKKIDNVCQDLHTEVIFFIIHNVIMCLMSH